MKKVYSTPVFECEEFELDASIASSCTQNINPGPQMGSHQMCDGYDGPPDLGDGGLLSLFSEEVNLSFYEDTCDCYTTGGGNIYWTS